MNIRMFSAGFYLVRFVGFAAARRKFAARPFFLLFPSTRMAANIFLALCLLALSALPSRAGAPLRILSITPAGTEILFDIGLGERVVGVTKYCSWPPEARTKQDIGDMMHVNMEVIVSLQPDLVLVSNMNEHVKGSLEAMGYPVVVVYQDNFEQICESMLRVGEACGAAEAARNRVDELRSEVRKISERAQGGPSRRVLIVVARDAADTSFKKIYVAGVRSFYNDLLNEAGAVNAFQVDTPYAQISREGLLRLDPDVVIELVGESGMENAEPDKVTQQWSDMRDVRASRDGSVAIILGDFTLRAGPRYPLILDAFTRIIRAGVREISE